MTDSAPDPRPEFAFIDWVRRRSRGRPEVPLSIGDDAALLEAGGRQWITAVDVITEGVHFSLEKTPPELIGRKALAINLSDIAAMAGEPCAAFIGIVLPKGRSPAFAEALYEGLFSLAEEWDVCIAGGDTNSWEGPLVISVTLMGLTTPRGAVRRSGSRPGDWIFVTGELGGSLQSGRHCTFTPRISEALALNEEVSLHALIDLSDGLASDLFHLLDAGPGADELGAVPLAAVVDGEAVPIHCDVDPALPREQRLRSALSDGEDFELLLSVSPQDGARLLHDSPIETRLTKIGEIVSGTGVLLRAGGTETRLLRGGWSHSM